MAPVHTQSATLSIARFSQDQFFLASADFVTHDIQLLSTSDPGQVKTLKGHQDSVGSIAFAGDNTFMASGDSFFGGAISYFTLGAMHEQIIGQTPLAVEIPG